MLREEMLHALSRCDLVELDFAGKSPTASFADQCVGGLAASLGLDEFRKRVRIANAPNDALLLLRHVVLKRAVSRPAPG